MRITLEDAGASYSLTGFTGFTYYVEQYASVTVTASDSSQKTYYFKITTKKRRPSDSSATFAINSTSISNNGSINVSNVTSANITVTPSVLYLSESYKGASYTVNGSSPYSGVNTITVSGLNAGNNTITVIVKSELDTKLNTSTNTTTYTFTVTLSGTQSNICFPAKTPVLTNSGYVNIEEINPAVHTIRNKKIVGITKTISYEKHLVRIGKHALGKNYPEKTTYISQNHALLFQGQMFKAKDLVDDKKVTFVPYNGSILYNVLLEQHEKMQVNNLIVETLHPDHKVAQMYRYLKNIDASHHGKYIELFNKHDREQRQQKRM